MAASEKQTLGFQAEVKQLLQLMIHSLYSNKEIFLRELISNASDAADKLRFEAIDNSALFENDPDLKITVSFDKEKRTITISDNGVGIPVEVLPKLFQRYQRADHQITGTGLGLLIVREIVEAHKGTVGVQSEPGKGTSARNEVPELATAREITA